MYLYTAFFRGRHRTHLTVMESISEGSEGILLESVLEGFKRSNGHNKSKLQSKQPIQCKTDKYSSNKQ